MYNFMPLAKSVRGDEKTEAKKLRN
jgi:hypothetical protein